MSSTQCSPLRFQTKETRVHLGATTRRFDHFWEDIWNDFRTGLLTTLRLFTQKNCLIVIGIMYACCLQVQSLLLGLKKYFLEYLRREKVSFSLKSSCNLVSKYWCISSTARVYFCYSCPKYKHKVQGTSTGTSTPYKYKVPGTSTVRSEFSVNV